MRTTLDLDGALLREARKRAAEEGRSLTSLIEEAVRVLLLRRRERRPYRLRLIIKRGTAPPAIDIADRVALYDRMEDRG
jgi:putative antitoxin of VapBC-like toxin-antitoxin system